MCYVASSAPHADDVATHVRHERCALEATSLLPREACETELSRRRIRRDPYRAATRRRCESNIVTSADARCVRSPVHAAQRMPAVCMRSDTTLSGKKGSHIGLGPRLPQQSTIGQQLGQLLDRDTTQTAAELQVRGLGSGNGHAAITSRSTSRLSRDSRS